MQSTMLFSNQLSILGVPYCEKLACIVVDLLKEATLLIKELWLAIKTFFHGSSAYDFVGYDMNNDI